MTEGKVDVTGWAADGLYRIVMPAGVVAEFDEPNERDLCLHRVKTYEALVEALDRCRMRLQTARDVGNAADDEALSMARAALSLAREAGK